MRWAVLLLAVCGCHFGWNRWQGARPRATNQLTLVLHAPDDVSRALAHKTLARDDKVTVIDLTPDALPPETSDTLAAGCRWAREQKQADYFAIASAAGEYKQSYVCTAHESVSLLDLKKEPECTEGHYENQHTIASYTLDVYDATTCEPLKALSTRVTTTAPGEEAESKPAALADLDTKAFQHAIGFPTQINIGADGRVDTSDNYYALYRDNRYRGYVAVENTSVRSLHCCDTPGPGDKLVARGERKLLEFALNGVVGSLTIDGERRRAGGAGGHIRYYKLDGGLQYGFGADLIGNPYAGANVWLITPEIGYAFRPSSAFSLSVNLGLGWGSSRQVVESMNDAVPISFATHASMSVRVVTYFTTWWYLGADAGYVYSGLFDTWDGDGAAGAKTISVRSPLGRAYVGFDL